MLTDLLNSPGGWFAQIIVLLTGLVIGLRKLYMVWGRDSVTVAEDKARRSIVQQLHDELGRISTQRLLVADELLKLQLSTNELIKQVGLLTNENVSLKLEVQHLRAEVRRLQHVKSPQSEAQPERE